MAADHAHDFDGVLKRSIENHVLTYGKTANPLPNFVTAWSDSGMISQSAKPRKNPIKVGISRCRAIVCYVLPDSFEIFASVVRNLISRQTLRFLLERFLRPDALMSSANLASELSS